MTVVIADTSPINYLYRRIVIPEAVFKVSPHECGLSELPRPRTNKRIRERMPADLKLNLSASQIAVSRELARVSV